MNFKFNREILLKPLQLVLGVIESKQVLPILANVLIIIEGNQLSIIATDLEIELMGKATLPEAVDTLLKFTLPARKLFDICRALPENSIIELIFDEKFEKVILKSGRSRYALSALAAEEFPHLEQQKAGISINLSQQKLRFLFQRTYFAMAHQDVRFFLNGLLLELSQDCLQAVATDGHRLAFATLPKSFSVNQKLQVIIPRKAIIELIRLLDNSENEITIEISDNNVKVVAQDYIFTSKLIEGRFPDYRQAIPQNGDKNIFLSRESLKQALNRSIILSNEKIRPVFMEFKDNLLKIAANNLNQESAEEELEIEYSYPDLGVGFNANYILDVLSTLTSDQVKITISGLGESMLIEEADNKESIFVIMPMHI